MKLSSDMAGRAFCVKVQLHVHAVSYHRLPNLYLDSRDRLLVNVNGVLGDVPRRVAVPERQSGSANRRSRLPRGIPPNMPDLPASVPRQIHLQQGVRPDGLPGGAAAHLGAGAPVREARTVGDAGRPRHRSGDIRDELGGSAVSHAVLQRSASRSGRGLADGADQVLSSMSLAIQFIRFRTRPLTSVVFVASGYNSAENRDFHQNGSRGGVELL